MSRFPRWRSVARIALWPLREIGDFLSSWPAEMPAHHCTIECYEAHNKPEPVDLAAAIALAERYGRLKVAAQGMIDAKAWDPSRHPASDEMCSEDEECRALRRLWEAMR